MNNTGLVGRLTRLGSLIIAAAVLATPLRVKALGVPFDMGSAGGWAILELGNGTVGSDTHINNPSPPAVADGNVGVVGYVNNGQPAGGTFNSSGPNVTGGLYLGTGASYSLSGGSQIQGGVTQNYAPLTGPTTTPSGAPVYNAALATYNFAKGLSVSAANTFATVNASIAFNTAGVYQIGTLDVHGGSITVNGSASDWYIFQITTKFNMQDAAQIVLNGGITADHVLWTLENGADVSTSGGLNQETILRGTFLGMDGSKVNLSPGALYGEVAVDGDISLASGASVVYPNEVPDQGSTLLLLSGAMGLIVAGRKIVLT